MSELPAHLIEDIRNKRDVNTAHITTLLGFIPDDWPVKNEGGKVTIPDKNEKGERLKDVISKKDVISNGIMFNFIKNKSSPEQEINTAIERIQNYITEQNHQTDNIRRNTQVTSNPLIAMQFEGNSKGFQANLALNLLRNNLEASGATVVDLAKVRGGNSKRLDSWPRDSYILGADGVAIPLYINGENVYGRNKKYQNESVDNAVDALKKLGITIKDISGGTLHSIVANLNKALEFAGISTLETVGGTLQGGDILQHIKSNTLFIGVAVDEKGNLNKEQIKSANKLAETMGMKLVTVPKTRNNTYYHLDTFMSVLPDGSVILLPDATTSQAKESILKTIKGYGDMLELPIKTGESTSVADDRRGFTTNIITVNGNSFTANALPEMKEFFTKHGLKLFEGPYQFDKSGVHCQTNLLKRGKQDGRSDIAQFAPEGLTRFVFNDVPKLPEQFRPNPTEKLGINQQTQLG